MIHIKTGENRVSSKMLRKFCDKLEWIVKKIVNMQYTYEIFEIESMAKKIKVLAIINKHSAIHLMKNLQTSDCAVSLLSFLLLDINSIFALLWAINRTDE